VEANYDGTNGTGTEPWECSRSMVVMAVLLALAYQAGAGHGRGEKTRAQYAALRSQHDKMLSEHDRAFGSTPLGKKTTSR
jgi:hypothetical protein